MISVIKELKNKYIKSLIFHLETDLFKNLTLLHLLFSARKVLTALETLTFTWPNMQSPKLKIDFLARCEKYGLESKFRKLNLIFDFSKNRKTRQFQKSFHKGN